MAEVKLKPYLRTGLDVLFVALNPSEQSNDNGHYFSGKQSRFFRLLELSGLINHGVDKLEADDRVFGANDINYLGAQYGVIDLVEERVETDSGKIKPGAEHVARLTQRILQYKPRYVCAIHGKIKSSVNRFGAPDFSGELDYGRCGRILRGSESEFFLNYFPNGNAISDARKLAIFAELKAMLDRP